MKIWPYAIGLVFSMRCADVALAEPAPTAIFPFAFVDTSLQGEMQGKRAEEQGRLAALDAELRDLLSKSGCCTPVDLGRFEQKVGALDLVNCAGCELDVARDAGARLSVTGWVQKVSNLILNINLVARDVGSGRVISGGSVDIRGNTDESWSRGIAYLLRDRLHPSEWPR